MARFEKGQYVAEIGLNGGSVAQVGAFNTTSSKLTLLKVNTSGLIEKSWREYDAETGVSVRAEYKGQTLAATKIVELPAELAPFAASWMKFEGAQIASLKDLAESVKRDARLAYLAAFSSLGAQFGIGVKKLTGKIGANAATCTVEVKTVASGLFGARVKFFDKDAEEAYQTLPKDAFVTDAEIAVAVGKAVKALSLPDAWAINKGDPAHVAMLKAEADKAAEVAKREAAELAAKSGK